MHTDIDLSLYPRWNDSCVWRPADDGLIIFQISQITDEHGPAPHHTVQHIFLNREGYDTWMLCTGENTIRDIVKALQKEYEGDEQAIQTDVVNMVAKMREEEFLLLEQSPCRVDFSLDENAYPRRSDDIIANIIEDNFIVMKMTTSEVHSFNRNVEHLWNICDGTHTVGEILQNATNADEISFLLHFFIKLDFLELKDSKT